MSDLPKTVLSAWRPTSSAWRAETAMLVVAGSLFLAICARMQVPMWPVPMTMQSFGVMALALAGGSRLALGAVGLYLAQGALGLPVFASGGGIAHFFGPTGGYLIGFLAMAWLIGRLADHGWSRTAPKALLAALAGGLLLYILGGLWLAALIGPKAALMQGVLPFLLGDLFKALLAALTVPMLWRLLASGR